MAEWCCVIRVIDLGLICKWNSGVNAQIRWQIIYQLGALIPIMTTRTNDRTATIAVIFIEVSAHFRLMRSPHGAVLCFVVRIEYARKFARYI